MINKVRNFLKSHIPMRAAGNSFICRDRYLERAEMGPLRGHDGRIDDPFRSIPRRLSPAAAAAEPFIGNLAHRLRRSVPDPLHKRPVEREIGAAFSAQEASNVLRVAIGSRHRRCSGDHTAVPIERIHRFVGLSPTPS